MTVRISCGDHYASVAEMARREGRGDRARSVRDAWPRVFAMMPSTRERESAWSPLPRSRRVRRSTLRRCVRKRARMPAARSQVHAVYERHAYSVTHHHARCVAAGSTFQSTVLLIANRTLRSCGVACRERKSGYFEDTHTFSKPKRSRDEQVFLNTPHTRNRIVHFDFLATRQQPRHSPHR